MFDRIFWIFRFGKVDQTPASFVVCFLSHCLWSKCKVKKISFFNESNFLFKKNPVIHSACFISTKETIINYIVVEHTSLKYVMGFEMNFFV